MTRIAHHTAVLDVDLDRGGAAAHLHGAAHTGEGHAVFAAVEAHQAVAAHRSLHLGVEGRGQGFGQRRQVRPLQLPGLGHRLAGQRTAQALGRLEHPPIGRRLQLGQGLEALGDRPPRAVKTCAHTRPFSPNFGHARPLG